MKNRKLLRIGTPVKLSRLRQLLDAVDAHDPENTIVLHHNRELIVEEAEAELPVIDDDIDPI